MGFDSLLDRYRDSVIASSEDGQAVASLAYDWRPGTFWRPKVTNNLAPNGSYLRWSAGPSAAPDGWTVTGAGATISQLSAEADVVSLPFAARVTRVGTDTFFTFVLDNTGGAYTGLDLEARAQVKAGTTSVAIFIDDGTTTVFSAHSGGGTYEVLSTSHVIPPGAPTITVGIRVLTSDQAADVDSFYIGETRGLGSGTPVSPQAAWLEVTPADDQLLRNWKYDVWSAGGEAFPDRWSSHAGILTRVTRISDPALPVGRYAMQIEAEDHLTIQSLSDLDVQKLRGCTAMFATHARAFDPGCRVGLCYTWDDGTISGEIAGSGGTRVHTGGGAFEWLETFADVPHDVQGIHLCLVQASGAPQIVDWSGSYVAQKTASPGPVPHAKSATYLALASANVASAGFDVSLIGSADNFATQSTVLSGTPPDDTAYWTDDPGGANTFGHWRLLFEEVADQGKQLEIGVAAFGEYLEWPCPPRSPYDPMAVGFSSEIPKTRLGAPLGRVIPRETKVMRQVFELLGRPFVKDVLLKQWWEHAGGFKGLPFFYQWNDGSFPDETFLVWLPDSFVFDPQEVVGLLVRSLVINFEALPR